jgi:hypothetical protein
VEEGSIPPVAENDLGTVKSTLAGLMATGLATGRNRSEHLDNYLDQPKPSRLRPKPVAALEARAVIRWQEMRAGREGRAFEATQTKRVRPLGPRPRQLFPIERE